jgi:hypothetical protein
VLLRTTEIKIHMKEAFIFDFMEVKKNKNKIVLTNISIK